ncbi:MAG: 4Fe-4S binding protein, partial [Myxococcales bacterium]|nr:4Fe-4S binding protein [Myxococcales bacterium]
MALDPKATKTEKPRPHLTEEFCKGCGRCVTACPKHCIELGDHIDPRSGLTPVTLDLEACSGCGLCFDACPEPFGLHPNDVEYEWEMSDPKEHFGPRPESSGPVADFIPDRKIPLPGDLQPLLIKGTYASAIGALVAGCRHFYGYPITPSTEGAELMAKVLPKLGGVFVQACSEVATVNHMYGAGGAGVRTLTFTSSPGLSLMLEGISYMVGAEVPRVFVNIMRGGPGLGNIGPAQSDI